MPRRRHYARRVSRPVIYRSYVSLAAIAMLVLGAACFFFSCPHEQPQHSLWSKLSARPLREAGEAPASNLIYPYSVVAGGVHNPLELREAIKTDPVAAAHYAGIDLSQEHVIKLVRDRYAYVSFRVGDNIYWTSHRLRLRKGETLLTDGSHYIRTRCGNRLSNKARFPIYLHEPSDSIMNVVLPSAPETEPFAAAELAPIIFLSDISPGLSRIPLGRPFEVSAPAVYAPFLSFFTVPGCVKKNSSGKHCGNPKATAPPPPLAPTPENGVWILFSSGMGIVCGYGLLRRKREVAQS